LRFVGHHGLINTSGGTWSVESLMTKVDWGQIWLGSDFKQMGVGASNNDVSQIQAHLL
jgi:hypothetical protein